MKNLHQKRIAHNGLFSINQALLHKIIAAIIK